MKRNLAAALLVLLMVSGPIVNAERLAVEKTLSYPIDSITDYDAPITAFIAPGDTVYSGCGAGLYRGTLDGDTWRRIVPLGDADEYWRNNCYLKEHFSLLYQPQPLAMLPDSSGLLLHDCYCSLLLRLPTPRDSGVVAEVLRRPWKESYMYSLAVSGDYILSRWSDDDGVYIDLRRLSDPHFFKRLFTFPRSLEATLEPLGIYGVSSDPAFSPVDSTVWATIHGYPFIYIIDLKGRLIDSVRITNHDFALPTAPPISRLDTWAVRKDWVSRWTPVQGIYSAPPDYMVLEYRIGRRPVAIDSVARISTVVWNADRHPVELEIDHDWRIAGSGSDGRVIFGHYECDGDTCRVVLDIARILP